ncbi:MarC family protein [Blastococcus litoris]|uniref:MarC family protein n=1 Tax=Blastococcus litoris TaxID=2171622 RepID=UPI0019CFCC1C|nr:MarC family protein [Blastococcus litoris]
MLEQPLLLFLALVALYSPVAALPSYFPVVGQLAEHEQRRLALALFLNTSVFALVALWIGEPLLEVLGLSTAALTATGGIALMYEGVALMRGTAHHPEAAGPGDTVDASPAAPGAPTGGTQLPTVVPATTENWRRVAFVPVTFPLTVGGTTFAFFVAFRAEAGTTVDVLLLSVAGLAYATVTALTVYASGHVQRRAKPSTAAFLDRIAGILLTAIAVTILISGVTRLVLDVLANP